MNEQDKRVRGYYASLSMPEERLQKLLKVAQSTHTDQVEQPIVSSFVSRAMAKWPNIRWSPMLQTGCACALIMVVSLWMHNSGSESEQAERTLREVAMNHTTRLAPEFRGTSLAMLDNSMHQLPFNLVLPKSIGEKYELIGSRYCSLAGVLAAHVKFNVKKSGSPMSLFVTSNSAELEQIQAQQKELEGVDVEIWREGGLFYISAQRS